MVIFQEKHFPIFVLKELIKTVEAKYLVMAVSREQSGEKTECCLRLN